jgi:hypothetical protein
VAGDWIKMRMDLPEDPAVYRLARITGLDRLSVIGRLYAFWAWADKHAVDGRVDGASTLDVDDITRHNGFADAMAQVKWLDVGSDYLAIPKHDRHNGESAKERSLKNARQAKWRGDKGVAVDEPPSTQASTQSSTQASTTASTREEKRREEKKTPTNVGESAKRATRKCPSDFVLTDEMRGWAAAEFPAVDLGSAFAKFRDHTFTKSITDWPATLRNWIRKEADFNHAKKPSAVIASFAQQEEAARRKRWEEMTGRKWPTDGDVIDITPDQQRISA